MVAPSCTSNDTIISADHSLNRTARGNYDCLVVLLWLKFNFKVQVHRPVLIRYSTYIITYSIIYSRKFLKLANARHV